MRSIRQTPDGYLWLATQSGLVRFDGAHFTVLDARTTPELGHDHVWSLAVAKDGSLWIGTNASLSRWTDGRLSLLHADGRRTRALLPARDGTMWVGMANGGVDRWMPRPERAYSPSNGLAGDSGMALAEDATGAIWIGTNHGVDRVIGGVLRHEPLGSELIWSL